VTAVRLPPAGWYPDPGGTHDLRWWDGERWTFGVSTAGATSEAALPPEGVDAAWEAYERRTPVGEDGRGAWPARVALIAVGAAVLSFIAGGVLSSIGAVWGDIPATLGGVTGLYGGFLLTCWLVSRRHGTGRFREDFGLVHRRGDWWRGIVVSILARLAGVVVAAVLYAISKDLAGSNSRMLDDHKDQLGVLLVLALTAVVLAPFFEELFFRGLLLRALESAVPVPVAIGLQASLFGLAHLGGGDGIGNVGVVLGTMAAGVLFGISAHRYRRLVPGMVAHACFNLVPVVILFATR
jgi:membrane protease YdiL (CAAX protease family)